MKQIHPGEMLREEVIAANELTIAETAKLLGVSRFKAIRKRKERDKEKNQKLKNDLQEASFLELRKSTEIPIEIANLCIQLAKYSILIFDTGFKSARGDSGVALANALAGITGCISIISLNLQSFPKSMWTDKMQIQKKQLKNEFDIFNRENERLMNTLDLEAEKKNNFLAEFDSIKKSLYGKSSITHTDIESLARRIQNALWKYKELIWGATFLASSQSVNFIIYNTLILCQRYAKFQLKQWLLD